MDNELRRTTVLNSLVVIPFFAAVYIFKSPKHVRSQQNRKETLVIYNARLFVAEMLNQHRRSSLAMSILLALSDSEY